MNKVTRRRVNDHKVLSALATLDPDILAIKDQLRARHQAYYFGDRNPHTLTPMGLSNAMGDSMRERYSAERVGDGLKWIKSFREDHDLDCCPMCGGTSVAQLDHILPKANYPEFSLFSFNLVPTCGDCNRRRSNKGSRFHFVHPYFDSAILDRLILVVRFRPPYDAVRLSLVPTGVSGNDLTRVENQLKETLPILPFRRRARRLWREWHRRFHQNGRSRTIVNLQDDLEYREAASRNSWEVAFLRGLWEDDVAQNWMVVTPTQNSQPAAALATPTSTTTIVPLASHSGG